MVMFINVHSCDNILLRLQLNFPHNCITPVINKLGATVAVSQNGIES